MTSSAIYDPWDCATIDDPYPHFARLRRDDPVHLIAHRGLWVVSRYDEVKQALRNTETFSSNLVYVGQPIAVPDIDEVTAKWVPHDLSDTGFAIELEHPPASALAAPDEDPTPLLPSLIEIDPPDHTRLRRLLAKPLNRMVEMEPAIAAVCKELLDDLVAEQEREGRADLKNTFALPLALKVTGMLMDVPYADARWLGRLAEESLGFFSLDPEVRQSFDAAYPPYARYFRERFSRVGDGARTRSGTGRNLDLMELLLEGDDQDQPMSDDEYAANAAVLFRAGFETTANLIVTALWTLFDHPDQFEAVRDDHSLIESALEETLRYDGPVLGLLRVTTRDAELGGTTIPKGSFVQLLFASANRDETQFDEPDTFRVTRGRKDHFTFGGGRHVCVGAALARLEARLALETILRRTRNLRPAGAAPISRSVILRGKRIAPIRFDLVEETRHV
jgi:cytochrome P450